MKKYYAYETVDEKGITDSWPKCQQKVKGVRSRFKSFTSKEEAQRWLDVGSSYKVKLEDGIYFDSGTGRGDGVEVRVTDKDKNSLLYKILKPEKINVHGNYNLGKDVTNNFGELVGLYLALKLAQKTQDKNIYGDSALVIDYWSRGIYNKTINEDTQKLIKKVTKLREDYDKNGGKIHLVSGDINPADLGFHK